MTGSSAVNWLIENANECSDGTRVFARRTLSQQMVLDIREYVENLDTDKKVLEPRMLNWVEDGQWFDLSFPRNKSRNSRARFENGRIAIHFECGPFTD